MSRGILRTQPGVIKLYCILYMQVLEVLNGHLKPDASLKMLYKPWDHSPHSGLLPIYGIAGDIRGERGLWVSPVWGDWNQTTKGSLENTSASPA